MLSETALVLHYMLYAMPRHLRIGQTAGEVRKGGGLLELSEGARLQQVNLEVVQSFGTNLLEVLAFLSSSSSSSLSSSLSSSSLSSSSSPIARDPAKGP